MMDRIEKVILRNLVYNEEYLRKVLPFIEPDYFMTGMKELYLNILLNMLQSTIA